MQPRASACPRLSPAGVIHGKMPAMIRERRLAPFIGLAGLVLVGCETHRILVPLPGGSDAAALSPDPDAAGTSADAGAASEAGASATATTTATLPTDTATATNTATTATATATTSATGTTSGTSTTTGTGTTSATSTASGTGTGSATGTATRTASTTATITVTETGSTTKTVTMSSTGTAVECPGGSHDCAGTCVSNTSVASCGTSCLPCPTPANGQATCNGTTCGIACGPSYHNCAGSCASNTSVASCGTSCLPCPTRPNGQATCDGTFCAIACGVGYHDCAGSCVSSTSVSSCGTSCVACPAASGNAATCDGTTCGQVCATGCADQLDQSCTGSNNLGYSINEGARYVGQTYTAGRSGTLSGVAVSIQAHKTQSSLRVSIRNTVGGLPGSTILATVTLATSESPLTNVIQFPGPVEQVAGQQYAIVADYPDAPPIGPGQAQGNWDGTVSNCYAGGTDVKSEDGATWSAGAEDLHFKVYVRAN
jgi:hypothetical protein